MNMRSPDPELSVFLGNYNHGRFIGQALDALLAQSVRPERIYVVDDASSDNSQAIIETYKLRHPEVIQVTLRDRN